MVHGTTLDFGLSLTDERTERAGFLREVVDREEDIDFGRIVTGDFGAGADALELRRPPGVFASSSGVFMPPWKTEALP
jgi:hypothetical protein